MKVSEIPLAQTVVQLCKAKNIRHIVISPGSRNAPLTISFTNDSFFTCYSIVDERCAGFFALGIAQQIKHPVALLCTSGSALLNYFPAVAEAFYSGIPLVVLSADRPKYLVGIGDGQTINQKDVYGAHVEYSTNLKLDIDESKEALITNKETPKLLEVIESKLEGFLGMQQSIQQDNETEINTAFHTAITTSRPVHINCPFDEPLYKTLGNYTVTPEEAKIPLFTNDILASDIEELQLAWKTSKRKLVLVGVNWPETLDLKYIENLASDSSVVVLTETTSNLHHERFFPSIDTLIMPLEKDELEVLQADLLVTFGGMVVSKKIKAFLRQNQPNQHWHIDTQKANDTFFCLNKHIKVEPNTFFKTVLTNIKTESNYYSIWDTIKKHRQKLHTDYLNSIVYSDLKVFDVVLKSLPDYITLHLGNSSTIRYTQLFNLNKTVKVFCNRGTSGIDGSTSTAIGSASVLETQTVFITGDLSFFYDSNALWNAYIPITFRVILINNDGGGIFRILPGNKNTDNFDAFFETKHNLNAKHLCMMYGFEYDVVSNIEELNTTLEEFYKPSHKPRLLEVQTPRTVNDTVLLDYFKAVR